MLEIRAIGFYPIQRAVDVIPGAPPINAELATFQAVLDTVREMERQGFEATYLSVQENGLLDLDAIAAIHAAPAS